MAMPSATVYTISDTHSWQNISNGNNFSQQPIMALTTPTLTYIKSQAHQPEKHMATYLWQTISCKPSRQNLHHQKQDKNCFLEYLSSINCSMKLITSITTNGHAISHSVYNISHTTTSATLNEGNNISPNSSYSYGL